MRDLEGTPLAGMESLQEGYEKVRRLREIQRLAEAQAAMGEPAPGGKGEEGSQPDAESPGADG